MLFRVISELALVLAVLVGQAPLLAPSTGHAVQITARME